MKSIVRLILWLGGGSLLAIVVGIGLLILAAGGVIASFSDDGSGGPGGTAVNGVNVGDARQVMTGSYDIGTPDPSKLGSGTSYTAPASIDYDGAPNAYAPDGSGLQTLDYLRNAGYPGNWWGIETDSGSPGGQPKIGPGGYYISTTSLKLNGQYCNSLTVPFVALPQGYGGARLGDYCLVKNNTNNTWIWCIFADVSPKQSKVEVSAAAAQALGIGFDKRGVTSNGSSLTVTVYPGSRNPSLR